MPPRDVALIDDLRALSAETAWVEFKHENTDPEGMGKRVSALSNAARIEGQDTAYMVWGVEDGTHHVVGTAFEPDATLVRKQPLAFWLAQNLQPSPAFGFRVVVHPLGRLVLLEILAEYERPPADPGPSDDERLRRLEDGARDLVASGHAVPLDDLLSRAGIEPCRVELAAPSDRPLSSEELFERVRKSVVVMAALEPTAEEDRHDLSLATGFVIDPAGIVVTNYHVVDLPGAPVLAAETADGIIHPVTEILAVSPFADIAICQLGGVDRLPALPLVAGAKPGQRLHALSHPDGALYSFTEGILSRYFVHRADGQAKTMFTTTVDFAVGSSGGPLVDDRGNVVGMVSSTLAVYASDDALHGDRRDEEAPPGDFQMGLNMCVPAADVLRLVAPAP
jgi:S1-C subfamily serine protease